ncbi:MAG TPA: PAS domain S-box protein [Dongiaceae bacterium]|nr:PAS domain S-box protein [Dongiaceae bacterium]
MRTMERPERYGLSLTDEGRYRLLVEAVTDYAIYMLDPDGYVTSWNAGARRSTGYERKEILGEHFSRFYTPEDRTRGLPVHTLEVAEKQDKCEEEGWRVRKDGTRFWAHAVCEPVHDHAGRLVGFAVITRDLTERRKAAEELKQSNEQFRILVQSVTDYAIYMLDPGGIISNWNAGAERLKGYRSDEIVGQHYSKFFTEEDREAGLPDRNLKIAARQGRFESEGWRIRKDGSRFWASVVVDPIRDETGKLLGFAKVTRDFTERRNTQQALEQAREALFQSQKLEAIGQLTGGVAHDFNNILAAILGSLELVRKRLPDDRQTSALVNNAILAAQRGATLTQRMLMFARRQKLHPERTDIPSLVRGMGGLMQRTLTSSVRIETRFPLTLPPVLVDPNQLESALLNLAINARDAMPGGGTIVIAAREESRPSLPDRTTPDHLVCLSVTDNGEGMDEETLERAVEPFFTTKGVGKGTGLGLSMVKGLADESNGRLVLKSKKGQGTTVELWLPVAHAEDELPKLADGTRDAATPPPPLTVLAVDDDNLVLMNVEAMLQDLGHNVYTASSAAEAMEVLHRGTHVDLIVSDQAMPHMTGIQLAELVKETWPDIAFVIATGYLELPTDVGDVVTLTKPYMESDLRRAIAAAIEGRRARAD